MGVNHITSHLSCEMLNVFNELSLLTMALTVEPPQRIRWDDDDFPGFGFYPTMHKLLAMQVNPNQQGLGNSVQEMCRLGALFFVAEIRRKFGIAPVITKVYSQKLNMLLQSTEMPWNRELQSIRIWVIMMAACAADTPADRTWAVKSLVRSGECPGLGAWDEIVNIAARMWWIDEVFSPKLGELEAEYRGY